MANILLIQDKDNKLEIDSLTKEVFFTAVDEFDYIVTTSLGVKDYFVFKVRDKNPIKIEKQLDKNASNNLFYLLLTSLKQDVAKSAGSFLDKIWLVTRNNLLDLEYAKLRTEEICGAIYCPVNNLWCCVTELNKQGRVQM